jgi:P4 family phage/plasmid primase-like protien
VNTNKALDAVFKNKNTKGGYSFMDGQLADAFKLLFGDKFIYYCKTVYFFNGVYWKPDNSNKSCISQFVDKQFCDALMVYVNSKLSYWTKNVDENITTDVKQERIKFWAGSAMECLATLRSQKTRALLVNNICDVISNDKQVWNTNSNMFCFENCVFDITTGEKVEANPLDFINMSCGYDYDDEYSLDLVTELKALITSIQPDKALKDYLLQVLSTSLLSEQIQAFFILTGKGGNGKSVLVELMVEMLGSYSYNLPAGFISKTIKEGGNPEASGMDCKRLVIVSEPESKDPICCATVKKITGDTKINVRPLYSNQTGIELKGTVIMICNEKPALDEVNDAVSRRMRAGVIPFGEKFVSKNEFDSTSDEEKKQFNMKLGDVKYVSQKFKTEYKQALFMILLPYFQHYQKTLFSDAPPIVIKESKAYIKGCDNICEWFEENYEPSDDSMVFVDDLFNNYSSTNEFYQLSKEDKRKYGTAKKFKEILQGNLFIRKYYKEKDQYWNKIQQKKPFISGWRKTVLVTEDCDVNSDTTTVVN